LVLRNHSTLTTHHNQHMLSSITCLACSVSKPLYQVPNIWSNSKSFCPRCCHSETSKLNITQNTKFFPKWIHMIDLLLFTVKKRLEKATCCYSSCCINKCNVTEFCKFSYNYRMQHRNGRLLEPFFSGTAVVVVRGVFAQGGRSPRRPRVQKVISFVVYFKIIFLQFLNTVFELINCFYNRPLF
jgi:hypothetical protein